MSFEGKIVVVSGGGAAADGIGNGRAAALLLAEAGASVVVTDRKPALADRTAEMIEAAGGTALAVGADATSDDDCARVAQITAERFGGVDILVNNVGVGGNGSVVDTDLVQWQRVMHINVTSAMMMSRHLIPSMIERGGGSVVNISSVAAMRPRGLTAYSTSKGAVITLTEAMAVDHGAQGVRVNCVAPGPVWTPMVGGNDMPAELRDKRRRASLLGIEGTAWDVAHAVRFLASAEARYITGQTLAVDGGVLLRGPGR